MGYNKTHGTKKESDMQEKKNLLNENAIDDTATSMGSTKMISGGHSKGKFMAPPKYKSHGTSKANYDKDMAEERIQIKDDKQKIYQDDKEKRNSSPTKLKGDQVKLDKNKNGRIDGGDFKMMQK